jgi:hypothetical protein
VARNSALSVRQDADYCFGRIQPRERNGHEKHTKTCRPKQSFSQFLVFFVAKKTCFTGELKGGLEMLSVTLRFLAVENIKRLLDF